MASKLITLPFRPTINLRGGVEAGAKLFVYSTGTTTPVSVYSDSALSTPLTNPVVADAFGVFPDVYYNDTQIVRVVMQQANGTVLSDTDPYVSDAASAEASADAAALSAAAAEAVARPIYENSAAGLAATTEGEFFYVDQGDGTADLYRHDAGPTATAINRTTIIDPQGIGAAGLIGGIVLPVVSRTVLAALDTSRYTTAYLKEEGREGTFEWDSSDLSTEVAADIEQGIYVPPTGGDGSSGAWVRQYVGAIQVDWFGAVGDNSTDDTTAIQAASDYASSLINGIERATLAFRPAGQYLISSTIDVTGHSIAGNGAALYSSTPITMLHVKCNNQQFDNLYLRFTSLQTSSAAIGVKLSENVTNAQASKNTFINVQTRFAYNGFFTLGGGAANGSIFGSTFINCRALKCYDWGWNLDCSTGTTTLTFINCQAEADSNASGQGKGFYIEGSTEVCMYNCAADKMYDGNALDVRNARSVVIDTFAAESCYIRTASNRLVNFSGSGDVKVDFIKVKNPYIDVGAGNTGYYCYFSSGNRAVVNNVEVTTENLTSGSSKKLRLNSTEVASAWISLDDVDVNANFDNFSGPALRGYATNAAGLPSPGTPRRTVWNRLPTFGEAAFWVDDGSEFRAIGPLLENQTTANLESASSTINTTGKFSGKPVYNTTTSEVVFATGSAAGDGWQAYDGSTTHTPV